MATRGNLIEQWNGDGKCIVSWLDRLKQCLVLDKITENPRKVAALLTLIGPDGYELLRALCAPEKPAAKEFDSLIDMLTTHLSPKPILMVERHKFQNICQGSSSITEFLASLRKGAEYCDYGQYYTVIRKQ